MALTKVPSNLDSITATTQSQGDGSTNVATTAYVDTGLANLIDSAPGNLNTLNELAAAMNDNASFFSTVLPLSGGTLTGALIGTTAAFNSGTTNTAATFTSTDAGAAIQLTDSTGSSKVEAYGANLRISVDDDAAVGSSAIQFRVDGSTKATIDSSGDLIVGGNSSGANDAVSISNTGYIQAIINGDTAGYFNRRTNDGEIIRLQKDGSTVGSIGTDATDIYIGTTDTGIRFNDAVNGVLPYNTSSGQTDGTVDLGFSTVRWRDAFLSGTVTTGTLITGAYGASGSAGDGFRLNSTDLYGQVDASDKVRIAVAGNSFFTGGNVGMGTASPTENLHIDSDTSGDHTRVHITKTSTAGTAGVSMRSKDASNTWTMFTSDESASKLYLYDGSAYVMTLDSNGEKVGIGTTSVDAKLHIEGNSDNGDADVELVIEDLDSTSGSQVPAILFKGNGSTIGRIRTNDAQGILMSGGTTMSDDLVVTNSGVGIGTTSIPSLLTIRGTGDALRIESTNAGAGGGQIDVLHHTASPADNDVHGTINFGGYYSGTNPAYGSSIRSVWSDVSAKEAKLEFYTRDDSDFTHKMAINHTGEVHFNYLSNDFRLRGGVYGSLFDSNPNMNHNIRYHASAGLYFNVGPSNSNFVFEQQGIGRFTISSSGGANGSDIKLKENVEDINYGLDTVKQLQARKFDWKGEDIPADEKAGIGFIAQEVESIIPELVTEHEHPDGIEHNTKMLNYGAMTSVLVKAIQELEARVKELEG